MPPSADLLYLVHIEELWRRLDESFYLYGVPATKRAPTPLDRKVGANLILKVVKDR
jgi:hypothetical protein